MTGQYYLRARYYNPVIARFTQEDTYYGDGLNLYTYCRNNPILNHDPTGHGTKENSPYSRKEQQYIDAGADPDTARLAAQCYPDAKSKQDLYNKYKSQGYNATDAKKLANYEIVHGKERAKNYAANNVKKSGPDYTPTSPRDNVNTDWRTQNRLNEQKKAGAGKTSYGKSSSNCTELVPYYPANNGAVPGTEKKIYLMAGDKIDRFGGKKGKFFSPTGTPMEMRALPYDADLSQYRQFEVVKPFEVEASTIAPAFGNIGLGTQYRSSVSVDVLLKKGIIKQVGGN